MSVLHTPRRRFGWPFARKPRPIDRVHLQTMPFSVGIPQPKLSDLKVLFAHGQPSCTLLGQTKPMQIIDSDTDANLADWVDMILFKAAASLGVPVSGLTVALSSLYHDQSSGRSWRVIAIAC
jgi:hypothetical protein